MKITVDRAVLEQALETLTENRDDIKRCESDAYMAQYYDPAIAAMREALAQPQQEPVAIVAGRIKFDGRFVLADGAKVQVGDELYTSPPARKPLTLGQKQRLWSSVGGKPTLKDRVNAYGLAIEAAHEITS